MNNDFRLMFAENETIIFKPLFNHVDIASSKNGVFEIFSDPQVLEFHPEKELKSISDADTYALGTLIGYKAKIHYNHFIFLKKTNSVIGVIEIRSPLGAFSKYEFLESLAMKKSFLKDTWLIDYYLLPEYWGRGIIPLCLSLVIKQILTNLDASISAFTHARNAKSKRILNKHEFNYFMTYDNEMEHWIKINNNGM